MNKKYNRLVLTLGTTITAAMPVVLSISCANDAEKPNDSQQEQTGQLMSSQLIFSSIEGNNSIAINGFISPTNPSGDENIKPILATSGITNDERDSIIKSFSAEGITLNFNDNPELDSMDELEAALADINRNMNIWLSENVYAESLSAPEIQEINTRLRYDFSIDHNQKTITVNLQIIGSNEDQSLSSYINDVFLNEVNGIKQFTISELDAMVEEYGFYFFMGVRPLTYSYLKDGFHLDKNFSNEAEFKTKLQGKSISDLGASFIPSSRDEASISDDQYMVFGPDEDIFVVVVPTIDPVGHEMWVNFEFYKGGTLRKGFVNDNGRVTNTWRTTVANSTSKIVVPIKLDGVYPTDANFADSSDFARDGESFKDALTNIQGLIRPSVIGMLDTIVVPQTPSLSQPVEKIKEAAKPFTDFKLYNNTDFVEQLYENSVADPDISVQYFIRYVLELNALQLVPHIQTASGYEVAQLTAAVLFIYENANFIIEWNNEHPHVGAWQPNSHI